MTGLDATRLFKHLREIFSQQAHQGHREVALALEALEVPGLRADALGQLDGVIERAQRAEVGFTPDSSGLFALHALREALASDVTMAGVLLHPRFEGVPPDLCPWPACVVGWPGGLRGADFALADCLRPWQLDGAWRGVSQKASGVLLAPTTRWVSVPRLAQLEARARWLSALNLPMIPKVSDSLGLATTGSVRWLAFEGVGGVSLRRWMQRTGGSMPVAMAVRLAIRLCLLAQALGQWQRIPTAFIAQDLWLRPHEKLTWTGLAADPCGEDWGNPWHSPTRPLYPLLELDDLWSLYPPSLDEGDVGDVRGRTASLVRAVAALLYWLVTGVPPYAPQEVVPHIKKVRTFMQSPAPRRPSAWVSEVPPQLDDVLMSALGQDPGARLAHCGELLERLWPLALEPEVLERTRAPHRAMEALRGWIYTADLVSVSAWFRASGGVAQRREAVEYVRAHVGVSQRRFYGLDQAMGMPESPNIVRLDNVLGDDAEVFPLPDRAPLPPEASLEEIGAWLGEVERWMVGLEASMGPDDGRAVGHFLRHRLEDLRQTLNDDAFGDVERALRVLSRRLEVANADLSVHEAADIESGEGSSGGTRRFWALLGVARGVCGRCLSPLGADEGEHEGCLLRERGLDEDAQPPLLSIEVESPSNLGFESGLECWHDGVPFVMGASGCFERSIVGDLSPWCRLSSGEGTDEGDFGVTIQRVAASCVPYGLVRLRVVVRARVVSGWAGAWVRVDGHQGQLYLDNMHGRALRGTVQSRTLVLYAPVGDDAIRLNYGLLLAGTGHIDARRFELSSWDGDRWVALEAPAL